MEPISAGIAIVGMGLQLFGGMKASETASHIAGVQKGIAADESKINDQKQLQMQLEARRMQMEQYRNIQRQRAAATAAATNQGASYGSGLQGGLAQVSDQGGFNNLGISQNLQFGNTIFGINRDISGKKMQLADLGADMASDQALSSLGGSLVKNSGTIGGLGQDIYSAGSKMASLYSPGSLSGGLT